MRSCSISDVENAHLCTKDLSLDTLWECGDLLVSIHLMCTCSWTSQWAQFSCSTGGVHVRGCDFMAGMNEQWTCTSFVGWKLSWPCSSDPWAFPAAGAKAAGSQHHPGHSVSPLWVLAPNLGTQLNTSPFLYTCCSVLLWPWQCKRLEF